jgi:8-oxo-dGTP pyrophosphatase MutT (NUDIX family)
VTALDVLGSQLEAISPTDEREAASITATLDRLSWPGDPFDQSSNEHHVTASAFVVSPRGVILLCHRLLNIWVQPGGHVDPGEQPPEAAQRETLEETGLTTQHVGNGAVFHVDVHPGPRGHTHYDLRYLLVAPSREPAPREGESAEVFWFDFAAALSRAEPALKNALQKVSRVVSSWNVEDYSRE